VNECTFGGHLFQISDGQLGHLLQLINEAHPFLYLANKGPRVGEV